MSLDEAHGVSGFELINGETVWNLHATNGFVLDLCIVELAIRGYIPTWDALLRAAEKDGTNISRLIRRIDQIAEDAYPERVADVVKENLHKLEIR